MVICICDVATSGWVCSVFQRLPLARPQAVSYTGFDKVLKVKQGNDSLVFVYGHDRHQISMEEHVGNTIRTKRYVGNCEYVTESTGSFTLSKTLTYLTGPTGVFAVVGTSGSTNTLHYVLQDNLGSWNTITDSQGTVEQSLSYDAWSNLRNPETWSGSFTGTPMLDRGFTGHEQLFEIGLINMKFTLSERSAKLCLSTAERSELGEANGRMYDPVMSCFLSPDNYMQCPDISQNFNRYAYCLNNPLRYTDPSGEVFGLDDMASFLIMTGVAVTMTVTQNGIGNTLHGRPFFQNAGQSAAMALIQSSFSFGIGEMAMGMGPGAFLFQMGAHATLDGTFTYFQGGDFWKGAAVGVASSFFSSLTNGLTANMDKAWRTVAIISSGTLSGGVTSKIMGGDFIDGAINGFITAGLNHALHAIHDSFHARNILKAARTFLIDLGYDEKNVIKDVTPQEDVYYGKYYAKMDPDAFESTYKESFYRAFDSRSKDYSAFVSKERSIRIIDNFGFKKKESFALKYYPERNNSIGVVRTGIDHYKEAGFEILDGILRYITK